MWLSPVTGMEDLLDCASARDAIAAAGSDIRRFLRVISRSITLLTLRLILSGSLELLRRHHLPGLPDMRGQFLVPDPIQLDPHPSARPNIRRTEVRPRRLLDKSLLQTWRRGNPDSDVSILVMIVGEHRKHALPA